MKETIDQLNGAVIKSIEIRTDDDTDSKEYGSYEYLIKTSRGIVRISGCHDSAGYIKVSDQRRTRGTL